MLAGDYLAKVQVLRAVPRFILEEARSDIQADRRAGIQPDTPMNHQVYIQASIILPGTRM